MITLLIKFAIYVVLSLIISQMMSIISVLSHKKLKKFYPILFTLMQKLILKLLLIVT